MNRKDLRLKKCWIALLSALLVLCQLIPVAAATRIPFEDVPSNAWYYSDVLNAYNMGLINGRNDKIFAPDDLLTHAEAIKLAACMYQVYVDDAPFVVSYTPWYQIYADYCKENGIIGREYDWDKHITRGTYMDIFSRALPKEALPAVNTVDDGMIPDVPMTYRYAQSIYKLYRAGIVRGQDANGTCAPESYVKRSEVAAILTRMMDESKRVSFTLADPSLKPPTGTTAPEVTPGQPDVPTIAPGGNTGGSIGGNTGGTTGGTVGGNTGGTTGGGSPSEPEDPNQMPWEKPGAKQPSDYTYAEFSALSQIQQQAFENSFGSAEAFDAWLSRAHAGSTTPPTDPDQGGSGSGLNPWEYPNAKQPADYSYAEFEALAPEQQMAFQNHLGTAFDAWLDKVQGGNGGGNGDSGSGLNPWEYPGAKQPADYTYAEFEALSIAQQMAFQNYFGSIDAFDAWLQNAQGGSGDSGSDLNPWEYPGAKQPSEYTYAEFEALPLGQQMAFQNHLGSAFDVWLQNAQGGGNGGSGMNPWEYPGAKQPSEYTYAEFEALPLDQQMAFQNYFGSIEAFDGWLQRVNPQG